MKNICIVPLIGIPGAGKTTLVKYIVTNIENELHIIHIDYDNIIKLVKSDVRFTNEIYSEIRNQIAKTVYILVQVLKNITTDLSTIQELILSTIKYDSSACNMIIIIDDTSYYHSMRYEYYKICKDLEISFYQIFLTVNPSLALKRNSDRTGDSKIPSDIIKRMAVKLEIPNNKNHWESNTLMIQSEITYNDEILNKIVSYTKDMFRYPLKKYVMEKERCIVEQSLLHKLDILLRKHVHELLKQIPHKDKLHMKSVSADLNEKRRLLLNDVKQGILHVTDETVDEFVNDNLDILKINV